MDEQVIRKRIAEARNAISFLEGSGYGIKFQPVADFKDKKLYPLDFQIYMEEIGQLEIGSQRNNDGVLILETQAPVPLPQSDDHHVLVLKDFEADEIVENVLAKKAMVVATDHDSDNLCYDTTVWPFELFSFFVKPYRFPNYCFIEWLLDYCLSPELEFVRRLGPSVK